MLLINLCVAQPQELLCAGNAFSAACLHVKRYQKSPSGITYAFVTRQ